jgi:hypothetical protein
VARKPDGLGPDGEGVTPRAQSLRRLALPVAALLLAAMTAGCAATRGLMALTQVDFSYDRVSDAEIAGIALSEIHSYEDIRPTDAARLAIAIGLKDVPLDLTVHLTALNPRDNDVSARMTALDWVYLVDGGEIVSGRLTGARVFPPGEPRDVPLGVTLNLARIFGSDGRALLETALVLSGQRTSTRRVTMRLTPYIETSAGAIRYPVPITLDLARPSEPR